MSAAVHPTCLATFVGYTCKHTVTVTICTESLIFFFFFCRDCMAAEWYFRERWVGVGGMDERMTPVSIPTGERKSLSEHNRKETEQKQAHVFLDIKSLPVGLWAASTTIFSLHLSAQFIQPFGRQRYWSSLFFCVCKKCACSCRYVSQLSQITRQ